MRTSVTLFDVVKLVALTTVILGNTSGKVNVAIQLESIIPVALYIKGVLLYVKNGSMLPIFLP